ncbi:MAG: pectin acetylesterase-family hydrolase [Bdellovibrionota bacterium]
MRIQSVLLGAWLLSTASAFAMGGNSTQTPNGDIFEAFVIPDAKCGDGSPYSVYIRKGNPSKLLMHFEGGGACWSKGSCFGKVRFTSLTDSPGIISNAYIGDHIGKNPFKDYTYIYIPYCTGDMHAGSHEAVYAPGKNVFHYGRSNFTKALAWIQTNVDQIVTRADELVVYGESAGALGVMMNLDQIAAVAGTNANKTALIDSPGLHFNDDIWKRFDSDYLKDLDSSLAANAMKRDPASGILAPQLKNLCDAHKDWKVGVTQASYDFVMSAIFGNITPAQHYLRVMSEKGIVQSLQDPNDNCSSWVPDTGKHMFSINKKGWEKETWDGVSNQQFTEDLLSSRLTDQHLSHH